MNFTFSFSTFHSLPNILVYLFIFGIKRWKAITTYYGIIYFLCGYFTLKIFPVKFKEFNSFLVAFNFCDIRFDKNTDFKYYFYFVLSTQGNELKNNYQLFLERGNTINLCHKYLLCARILLTICTVVGDTMIAQERLKRRERQLTLLGWRSNCRQTNAGVL